MKRNFNKIWCPFDFEDSAFVRLFRQNGFDVIHTHIEKGEDFFKIERDCDCIISNPPYSFRNEVLERLYFLDKPFAMLMNYTGLFDNKKRFDMFKENGLQLFVLLDRTAYKHRFTDFSDTPMFQSIYVCNKIFDKDIVFEDYNQINDDINNLF